MKMWALKEADGTVYASMSYNRKGFKKRHTEEIISLMDAIVKELPEKFDEYYPYGRDAVLKTLRSLKVIRVDVREIRK